MDLAHARPGLYRYTPVRRFGKYCSDRTTPGYEARRLARVGPHPFRGSRA